MSDAGQEDGSRKEFILLALAVNEQHKDDFIFGKIKALLPNCRFAKQTDSKQQIEPEERKIISLIKNQDYAGLAKVIRLNDALVGFHKKRLLLLNRKNAVKLNQIDKACIDLERGVASSEFILYSLNLYLPNYPAKDRKNLSHHLKSLAKFVSIKSASSNNKRDYLYILKKQVETFNELNNIFDRSGLLNIFMNTYYYANLNFTLHNSLSRVFYSNPLNSQDLEETSNLIDFKIKSKELVGYKDSISLKRMLVLGINEQISEGLLAIFKRNNLSNYASLLMLEQMCFIIEAMQGKQSIDQQHLEKCFLSLYNGDAKSITEKEIRENK